MHQPFDYVSVESNTYIAGDFQLVLMACWNAIIIIT